MESRQGKDFSDRLLFRGSFYSLDMLDEQKDFHPSYFILQPLFECSGGWTKTPTQNILEPLLHAIAHRLI
jgi:hypothetical protein